MPLAVERQKITLNPKTNWVQRYAGPDGNNGFENTLIKLNF